MENNALIIGTVTDILVLKNKDITDVVLDIEVKGRTVTNTVQVIVRNSDDFYKHLKIGKDIEVIGNWFTRRVYYDGKIKCVQAVAASSISFDI